MFYFKFTLINLFFGWIDPYLRYETERNIFILVHGSSHILSSLIKGFLVVNLFVTVVILLIDNSRRENPVDLIRRPVSSPSRPDEREDRPLTRLTSGSGRGPFKYQVCLRPEGSCLSVVPRRVSGPFTRTCAEFYFLEE